MRTGRITARAGIETQLGEIGVEATEAGLSRVRLPGDRGSSAAPSGDRRAVSHAQSAAAQLREYFAGERVQFELELDWSDVDAMQRRVLETLCQAAPYGTTVTYGELGRRAGVEDPRDVGVLVSRNPLPLVVPCHRVVAADGLGGYGGGLELKEALLQLEGALGDTPPD